MTGNRQAGKIAATEMLSLAAAEGMENAASSGDFAGEMGLLALDNVFGALWSRPGLGRRERSLVTLGILIALRAHEELHYHIPMALKNGLTPDELAEVIYQATGYAGFPAAASARAIAVKILAAIPEG